MIFLNSVSSQAFYCQQGMQSYHWKNLMVASLFTQEPAYFFLSYVSIFYLNDSLEVRKKEAHSQKGESQYWQLRYGP
jgi:hypothetical protein